jgi:hypothetical protein
MILNFINLNLNTDTPLILNTNKRLNVLLNLNYRVKSFKNRIFLIFIYLQKKKKK